MWSVYVQMFSALALGIYLGGKIAAGDAIIFIIALAAASVLRRPVLKKFFSAKVFILFMAALGIISYHWAVSENARNLHVLNDRYITAVGKIVDLPETEEDRYIYIVDIQQADYLDKVYRPNERVRISSEEKFEFGDCIKVQGFLESFPETLNRGDFDTARHYKCKGIYFKMFADEASLSDNNIKKYSITYFATWVKSRITDKIYENYSGDEAAVLKAVFTGYKDGFSPELEEELYRTNTMRLFYPAFLHCSLIMSIVGLLSSFIKKSWRDKLLIGMLIVYAAYNFNNHYIVKTALIGAVLVFTKMKLGYSYFMESLCVLCTVICLINPLVCYGTGFVMSVAASILIYYFVPPVMKRIKGGMSKRTKRIIAVWIVLTVGTLPLNAYYFSVTNPYSFLLTFIYMPVLNFLWMAVSVNIVITSVINIHLITYMTQGLLYIITKLPTVLSGLPFYSIALPRPSVVTIIIFYLLLYIVYRRLCRDNKDDYAVSVAAAVIIGLSITTAADFADRMNDISVNIVNVGQGDGAVISVPFHETVLIDGGGSSEYSDYDYGEKIFVPFLKRNGYTDINAAVVTHYHSDHARGIIDAMKELKVREVIIPDCMEDNKYRMEIEKLAEEKDIKLSYYKSGTRLRFKSGMTFQITAPDDVDLASDDENDRGYGIKVTYGEFSALFMADLSKDVELRHLNEWGDCDVLKVGHHGSKTSSCGQFLEEVKPEAAIISVGKNNTYALPNDEVLKALREYGADIYRTDICGNITVRAEKSGKYKIMGYYN